MAEVQLTAKFLNDLMDSCSRTTVGKVMKRVDLFEDKETLKKAIKELIYEEYRTLKALLEAHSNGLLSTRVVEFKTEKDRCQQ
jgi:hypothetical protein